MAGPPARRNQALRSLKRCPNSARFTPRPQRFPRFCARVAEPSAQARKLLALSTLD